MISFGSVRRLVALTLLACVVFSIGAVSLVAPQKAAAYKNDMVILSVKLDNPSIEGATITWKREAQFGGLPSEGPLSWNGRSYDSKEIMVETHTGPGTCNKAANTNKIDLTIRLGTRNEPRKINLCDSGEGVLTYAREYSGFGDAPPRSSDTNVTIKLNNTGSQDATPLSPDRFTSCYLANASGQRTDCDQFTDSPDIRFSYPANTKDAFTFSDLPEGSYLFVFEYRCETTARCESDGQGDFIIPRTSKQFRAVAGQLTTVTANFSISRLRDSVETPVSEEDRPTSCEDQGGWAWAVCPLIKGLDEGIEFFDNQIQSLLLVPESDYDNDALRDLWGVMRNLALLILVPIMLVMVISTALGFDFVDAYTVRKALPRLFIAVIFISLSWEITTFLVHATNVLGKGVLGIVTSPLGNDFSLASLFDPQGGQQAGLFLALAAGTYLAFSLGPLSLGVVLSFAFVIFLLLFTIFMILVLRQVVILALMLVAPLAILAWIFPGNDKMWKLWWSAFWKLLIMFPLIMFLIGTGRLFAYVVNFSQDGFPGIFLKLAAYIGPYFFIPYTFKFAGGLFATVTGMVNDRERGLFDRNKKYRQQAMHQNWDRKGARKILQSRSNIQGRLEEAGSRGGRTKRFLARNAARGVGGYNLQAAVSARNAAVGKELKDQIATGKDDEIRGLTVDMAAINRMGQSAAISQGLMRVGSDGTREYKSLGGAWVGEANVLAGHKRWGNDTFAQQTALSYEMRKAMTEEQTQGLASRYGSLATGQWGMSDRQAGGAWIGGAFENQNEHLEYKYTSWRDGTMDAERAKKYVDEVYEKKGSYPLAQMGSNTIEQLKNAHTAATAAGDVDTLEKLYGISETFMSELAGGGVHPGTSPEQLVVDEATGATGRRQAHTPGSAHVAERVLELARLTGSYDAAPSGSYTEPTHAPTPNQRGQKNP